VVTVVDRLRLPSIRPSQPPSIRSGPPAAAGRSSDDGVGQLLEDGVRFNRLLVAGGQISRTDLVVGEADLVAGLAPLELVVDQVVQVQRTVHVEPLGIARAQDA
jgi:hypothetical protein